LKKTSDIFDVCIINNSGQNIYELNKYINSDKIEIINNNINAGYTLSINQSLYYSAQNGYDYSIVINSSYAIVVYEDWISEIFKNFDMNKGIGGYVYPIKITGDETFKKVLFSVNNNDPVEWLSKYLNKYMITNCIDGNIFVINNNFISNMKMPDPKYCNENCYGVAMSLAFMKMGIKPVNLQSIYSSSVDLYRYDIFNIIKNGTKILYPVVIDSVRNKFAIGV